MGVPRAILIAGPTASGKSAVALALARRLGGAVINADSMQVYRELSVLTARPSAAEEAVAPHRLYGFVPAAERYSVGRWLVDVRVALDDVAAEGLLPIVTGGTGLYFKALLEGLSPVPDVPEAVRERWRALTAERSGPELHGMLAERDPVMAARLRPSDRQRLVRALEVLDATGRSLADWQATPGEPALAAADTARLVVAPPRDALYARIDARFDRMLAEGALDDVARLRDLGLAPDLPAMRALGVRALMAHLAGEAGLEEAAARAKTETRRYAKRQMTWLRGNMISWEWYGTQDSERISQEMFAIVDD
ncbi:MAG: tRNA (adenosine(37)-N6)-dimethylallyltransferase MiaA [Hyphomicrobiales bacterium]|nr:tRNA (adenosine(37)-N6)-dimethylallyltransferase MiaA [Hyphomicrobiales bacterium]